MNHFAGLYLPGGHGCLVNLPENVSLGQLLHAAHAANIPTALCRGPSTLLAANKVPWKSGFPYKGYKCVTFTDKTNQTVTINQWLFARTVRVAPARRTLEGQGHVDYEHIREGETHVDQKNL